MEPEELAASIKALNAWAQARAPHPVPEPTRRLREHFDADPATLPIVTRALKQWDRPNLQVAIDAFLAERVWDLLGLVIHRYQPIGLADLARGGQMVAGVGVSEPERVTVSLGSDAGVACVQSGLWLVDGDDERLALMLKSNESPMSERVALQVMAEDRRRAEAVVAELWELMSERNVYRGRVVEMRSNCAPDESPLSVRSLPKIAREQIVLAPGVLERIERTTFGVARHAERLRASGSSARRSASPGMPNGCARAAGTCVMACSCMARRASARR